MSRLIFEIHLLYHYLGQIIISYLLFLQIIYLPQFIILLIILQKEIAVNIKGLESSFYKKYL